MIKSAAVLVFLKLFLFLLLKSNNFIFLFSFSLARALSLFSLLIGLFLFQGLSIFFGEIWRFLILKYWSNCRFCFFLFFLLIFLIFLLDFIRFNLFFENKIGRIDFQGGGANINQVYKQTVDIFTCFGWNLEIKNLQLFRFFHSLFYRYLSISTQVNLVTY